MAKTLKSRWWWFICYPDSLPDNWIDVLTYTGIPFIVSPLHDKDINGEGEYKKPHYHVVVVFDNPTTYNHVLTHCCKPINATIPQVILNLAGSIAYLTHKGLSGKAQYQIDDLRCFNGSHVYLKDEDYVNDVYTAIETIILEECPQTMRQLLVRCRDIPDALAVIRSRPYYWRSLL